MALKVGAIDGKSDYQRIKSQLAESISMMNISNPQVIPRNHKVEAALLSAEEGNFEQFYDLLENFEESL